MRKAVKYINNLEPLGGTEILDPIKFALYEKNTDKIILLFTDGQVGNEEEIIKFVENNVNRSRIFPFGIDTNVNSSFIKQLAKAGNGKAELIQPKEKIDDKIIRTFARIQTPLLEEIKIDYGNNKVLDEIREEKCLFNYEFFNVFAKIEKLEDDIRLKGKILDKEYIWKINKENIYNTDVDLEVLFTKQEMEQLEEYIRNTYEDDKIENYKKMIIELSEKYNINSKYTSFITVYEREEKLLEVPKYQETKLSKGFTKGAIMNKVWDMLGMDECEEDYEEEYECDLAAPSFLRKNSSSSSEDLDIPCFLRKKKAVNSEYKSAEIKKTNEEILAEKVDDYYKVFISQDEKPILTFLLYTLYYLRKRSTNLNYNDLLRFLGKYKDELLESELYLKLLCLCYKQLDNNRVLDKKETLELMDDNFRKIAVTNLKIKVDLRIITEEEIQELIRYDKVLDNIDDVIWYLTNRIYSFSWLR